MPPPVLSEIGTSQTFRNVRFCAVVGGKADVEWAGFISTRPSKSLIPEPLFEPEVRNLTRGKVVRNLGFGGTGLR